MKLKMADELAEAMLRYHLAIAGKAFADDIEYCMNVDEAFARGEDLDSLYHDMLNKAFALKAALGSVPRE